MNCSPPGSSIHGILQARTLEWIAMPSSRASSWPKDQSQVSPASCIGRWVCLFVCFLPLVASGKTKKRKGQTANKGSRETEQEEQTNKITFFCIANSESNKIPDVTQMVAEYTCWKGETKLLQSLLTNQIQRKLRGPFLLGMLQASVPIPTRLWLSRWLFLLSGLFCFSKPGVRRPGF